jgi:predicted nuclease with TOPRIM domain
LIYDQAREREEVEQAHLMEYQDFNKRWDEALAQIEAQDHQAIRALEDRHIRDLEENRQKLEQKLPLTFKLSAELLNLKQIQGNLAR